MSALSACRRVSMAARIATSGLTQDLGCTTIPSRECFGGPAKQQGPNLRSIAIMVDSRETKASVLLSRRTDHSEDTPSMRGMTTHPGAGASGRLRKSSKEDAAIAALERFCEEGSVVFSDGPLGQMADRVVRVSGIRATEGALLIGALAAGSAAGASCELEFGGERVNSSLSIWLIAGVNVFEWRLVSMPFEPLRAIMDDDVIRAQNRAEVDATSKAAFSKLRTAQSEMAEAQREFDQLIFHSIQEREEFIREAGRTKKKLIVLPKGSSQRAAADYAEARQKVESAQREIGKSLRLVHPLSVLNALCPEEVALARKHAIGQSLVLLGPGGDGILQLLQAPPKQKQRFARAMLSSFEGSVALEKDKVSPPAWTALAARVREDRLPLLVKDKSLQDLGLLRRSLFVDLTRGGERLQDFTALDEEPSEYKSIITSRFGWESEQRHFVFRLTPDAVREYERFCRSWIRSMPRPIPFVLGSNPGPRSCSSWRYNCTWSPTSKSSLRYRGKPFGRQFSS